MRILILIEAEGRDLTPVPECLSENGSLRVVGNERVDVFAHKPPTQLPLVEERAVVSDHRVHLRPPIPPLWLEARLFQKLLSLYILYVLLQLLFPSFRRFVQFGAVAYQIRERARLSAGQGLLDLVQLVDDRVRLSATPLRHLVGCHLIAHA